VPLAAYPGVSSEQLTPCLALLPTGVAWPRTLLPAPVSSYLTFSPSHPSCILTQIQRIWGDQERVALCLCGPIRQITPSRELPGAVLYEVRTFLDAILRWRRDHPASLRHVHHTMIFWSTAKHR